MIKTIVKILIALGIANYLFTVLEVVGFSMYPTYISGEVLYGLRFPILPLIKESIYVYKIEGKYVIKRLKKVKKVGGEKFCWFEGDNASPNESRDSRDYGWVSAKNVKIVVLFPRENEYAKWEERKVKKENTKDEELITFLKEQGETVLVEEESNSDNVRVKWNDLDITLSKEGVRETSQEDLISYLKMKEKEWKENADRRPKEY